LIKSKIRLKPNGLLRFAPNVRWFLLLVLGNRDYSAQVTRNQPQTTANEPTLLMSQKTKPDLRPGFAKQTT
jgi:hypothetical protein